jgi:hypothetical protein
VKGGGHPFAALAVGSRGVGKRKTLDAIRLGQRKSERQAVKQAPEYSPMTLLILATCGVIACAKQTPAHGNVTIVLQWPNAASADTLILDARPVPLHESLAHDVPSGAMALEGYMLGSSEQSTMFGWVNAQESPRLPVFTEINAVPDLLEALHDLPALPRSRAVPPDDTQDLLLFFLDNVGDPPRREVVARYWAHGGSRMLRIDPQRSMVRAKPLLRLRDRDLPDTSVVKRLRIRIQGPPELNAAIPFLIVRDGDRWTAATLSWNRLERVEFTAADLPDAAPGRLILYLFAPATDRR